MVPPFSYTAMDAAGPWFTSQGREKSRQKRWILIYRYPTTGMIYLYVLYDMLEASCLRSLTRFTSRQMKPKVIYCDLGTNFVGAKNTIEELWTTEGNFNEFIAQWTNEYVEKYLDNPSESTIRDLLGNVAESYSRSSNSWDSVKVRGQWGARIARVLAEVSDHKQWIIDDNSSLPELEEWNNSKRHLQTKAKASARKLQFFLFLSDKCLPKLEDPLGTQSADLMKRHPGERELLLE